MTQNTRPVPIQWIDHFVVGTNDMGAWLEWAIQVIGADRRRFGGLTTETQKRNRLINCFNFIGDGSCHFGAFLQREQMPPSEGLAKSLPRHGFFIRPEDIDEHLARLKLLKVPHQGPVDTRADGEDGIAIYFADPDGNQYEFWAPARMPAGAMEVATPLKVGRISSVVYGARDLRRTWEFFSRYFSFPKAVESNISKDTLVLPLQGGARMVFKLVNEVDERTIGHRPWVALHTALTVPDDEFFVAYNNLWGGVPEWEDAEHKLDVSVEEENELPPRTGLHTSPVGRKWKEIYARGEEFYDWDTHAFHLVGGVSNRSDGSLATYIPKDPADKLQELVGDFGPRPT